MPVTKFENLPEYKSEIINILSKDIALLHEQIKKMKKENDLFVEISDLGSKYNLNFEDNSQFLRNICNFIAVQAYEVGMILKKMILSDSEIDDIPLNKQGILVLQEGCKKLIGFNVAGSDKLIQKSLLYKIHNKAKLDHPDICLRFEKVINDFRDKLESKDIKENRALLTHYQKNDGISFNSFNFTDMALTLKCDDVYDLLFDYYRFLQLIAGYVRGLMNLGYK